MSSAWVRLFPRIDREFAEVGFRVQTAVALLAAAGGLMVLSLCEPDYLRPAWRLAYIAIAVVVFLSAALIARAGQLPGLAVGITVLLADLDIVFAVCAQLDRSAAPVDAALLTLPTLFIAVFLSWGPLLAQTVGVVSCALVILGLGGGRPWVIALQAVVVVSSATFPGVIVLLLRNQLTLALEEARALATTDPLTGLLNRRGLDERAAEVSARARRAHLPVGVLVADLDHFKKVNDQYGHTGGDEVLRTVSMGAGACVRTEDLVVRLGGEEIAVIGVLAPDELEALAERLRRTVERVGAAWGVTVSIGTAWRLAAADDEPDILLWALVDAADDRMYEAKRAGRNQVRGQPATHP